jgi:hypothetical protein
MKNILFTILLLISFDSLGQAISLEDVAKGSWKEGIVRKYLDQFDDLKDIEGIYNYSTNDPRITSSYKLLILFDENEFVYKGLIMEANCVGCQHWRYGERKVILEESAMEGEFNYKWYQPGKRNRKGKKKKSDTYVSGEAYEQYDGIEITLQFTSGGNVTLLKKYPK